ncbi:STAS domain-containing protein [Saccharothrix sp. S26]|uniref:STAS domain-containing protein n=1 Tax=Saccharothrix sp. S26 TaxID=2907215 RepID=UPI001F1E5F00|nr:STAS domain-containing protein [Saccharothrix sp. S26]MCE6997155.1 STAS domain-containing protein [Saccharothrix sp. S26]
MTEPAHRLTTTELDRGILLVAVSGALDAATHRPVVSELDAVFEAHPSGVVLDLGAVEFMGSVGIAMLVNSHHRANRLRIPFAIVVNSRAVLRPLQISQVDAALPLHPSVDAAVAALRLVST